MLTQLNKLEPLVGTLKDAKDRLIDREGAFLRKTYKPEGVTSKVKAHIDKARKDADVENLTSKYGTVIIGIHGQELPKFRDEDDKEWWKNNPSYTKSPDFGQSRLVMKET